MGDKLFGAVLALIVIAGALAVIYLPPAAVYIDCSLQAFSPDFTTAKRNLCRKLKERNYENK